MIFARLSGRAFLWMGFCVLNKDDGDDERFNTREKFYKLDEPEKLFLGHVPESCVHAAFVVHCPETSRLLFHVE